ncbi:MAG: anti-sigma factor [Chloroflexi bacterium]|nr:anti-sigma factor [Chloroflexota bacterium]
MDCNELLDLIPAYRIGAADAEEVRQIEAALERCPELAAEIARYDEVALALAEEVPQTVPPAALLGQVLAAARQTTAAGATTLANVPAPRLTPAPPVETSRRRLPLRWLAAAAVLLIFFAANNLYWIDRLNTERSRQLRLPSAVEGEATNAWARVLWSGVDERGVLIAGNFPPRDEDVSFQAWVRRDDVVTSLGVFQVDETGMGSLTFDANLLSDPFEAMGVTIEPMGGSPGPTGNPVVRWVRQ